MHSFFKNKLLHLLCGIPEKCGTQHASIAAKCLKTLSGLFSRNLIDQSSCRILTIHAKTRPILHDDSSIRLGENRPKTFGSYAQHFLIRPLETCHKCLDSKGVP